MVAISNSAGISAPFLFPQSTAPLFSMGNWTIFAFLVVSIATSLYAWYVFGSHSGYRGGVEVLGKNERNLGFADVESRSPASASTTTLEVDVLGDEDEKEAVVEIRPTTP